MPALRPLHGKCAELKLIAVKTREIFIAITHRAERDSKIPYIDLAHHNGTFSLGEYQRKRYLFPRRRKELGEV
jgi:hypothetical protein